MKNAVTKRQVDLLTIIYQYIKDTGYPPTFEEMRESLGVSSNQSVKDLLHGLEKGGLIKKREGLARGLSLLSAAHKVLGEPPLVPFAGFINAGTPVEAIDISGEWEILSGNVAKLKEEVFLLKVSGDSMINAGIDDEDLLLVKKTREFKSGDVVVARNDDGTTVKRFIVEPDGRAYLKPENPAYKIIPIFENTIFEGKVMSVFKSGNWKMVK